MPWRQLLVPKRRDVGGKSEQIAAHRILTIDMQSDTCERSYQRELLFSLLSIFKRAQRARQQKTLDFINVFALCRKSVFATGWDILYSSQHFYASMGHLLIKLGQPVLQREKTQRNKFLKANALQRKTALEEQITIWSHFKTREKRFIVQATDWPTINNRANKGLIYWQPIVVAIDNAVKGSAPTDAENIYNIYTNWWWEYIYIQPCSPRLRVPLPMFITNK